MSGFLLAFSASAAELTLSIISCNASWDFDPNIYIPDVKSKQKKLFDILTFLIYFFNMF